MAKKSRAKRVLRHLGRVGLGIVSLSLVSSPVGAVEETKKVVDSVSTIEKVYYRIWTLYFLGAAVPAPGAPVSRIQCFTVGMLLHAVTLGLK